MGVCAFVSSERICVSIYTHPLTHPPIHTHTYFNNTNKNVDDDDDDDDDDDVYDDDNDDDDDGNNYNKQQ